MHIITINDTPRAIAPSSTICGHHTARSSSPSIATATAGPGLPLRQWQDDVGPEITTALRYHPQRRVVDRTVHAVPV